MGCFSGSCAISHFGIAEDEKCLKVTPKVLRGIHQDVPYESISYTYDIMQDLINRKRAVELYELHLQKHEEGSNFYIAALIQLESAKEESPFSYVGYGDYDDYGNVYNVDFEIGEDEDEDPSFFIKEEVIQTILGRSLTEETFYDDMYKIASWCMWNRIQLCRTDLLGSQHVGDDSVEMRQQYIDMQQKMLDKHKEKYK